MPKGFGHVGAVNRAENNSSYDNSQNARIVRAILDRREKLKRAMVIAGIRKYKQELLNKSSAINK